VNKTTRHEILKSLLDCSQSVVSLFCCVTIEEMRMLTEVTSQMERTQCLSDELREQAESHRRTLQTMIDLASKITASRTSLSSGLRDAKQVFGQLEPVSTDWKSLQEHRDTLQVFVMFDVECNVMLTCLYSTASRESLTSEHSDTDDTVLPANDTISVFNSVFIS